MAVVSPPRLSRVDIAYKRLKSAIMSNSMQPGFRASEPELASRLGMSRTPVREALGRLEAEGLIRLTPRRGARVLPVSPATMRDIYQLLSILEPEVAAALARETPKEAQIRQLALQLEKMELALEARDLTAWALADDQFHRNLLSLHPNRQLVEMVSTLFDQAHRARLVTLHLRTLPIKSTREHWTILEHIQAGNALAVRDAFYRHRKSTAAELLALLEEYELPRP